MNYQENVKNRLERYIENEGVTQKFICKKIGLSQSTLSKFRNNKKDIELSMLINLDGYLKSKNY